MRLPPELLLEILQYSVEIFPFADIFKARLVNGFFNQEILFLLLDSRRFEIEGLGFPDSDKKQAHWASLPESIKRQYLRQKFHRYPHELCAFSIFVHKILHSPAAKATNKEAQDLLAGKLIDTVIHGTFDIYTMFSREGLDWYVWCYGHWWGLFPDTMLEPFEDTLRIALACSAITRGNCAELQALLGQGLDISQRSYRFDIVPLELAAKIGNRDIIRTLVQNQCPVAYGTSHGYTNALSIAAQSGNEEALEVWIGALESQGPKLLQVLSPLRRSALSWGKLDIVQFIDRQSGMG